MMIMATVAEVITDQKIPSAMLGNQTNKSDKERFSSRNIASSRYRDDEYLSFYFLYYRWFNCIAT